LVAAVGPVAAAFSKVARVGPAATGGKGGSGGFGGGINGGTILQTTAVRNATGGGAIGGAPGTPGSGGAGGAKTGGGTHGQHGDPGTATAGDLGPDGLGGGTFGATTLTNSLFDGNTPSNCADDLHDGGHNITFPSASCPGRVIDPRIGPLQDNGGPVPTVALLAGSPALDAIPGAGAGCPKSDERGVRRPQQRGCDIGAYENLPAVAVTRKARHVSRTSAVLGGVVTPNAHAW
jgi:hypothetical protein